MTISEVTRKEILEFCRGSPRHHGLYLTLCNVSVGRLRQARLIVGLARRRVTMKVAPVAATSCLGTTELIVDASQEGKHAALWYPVALDLAERGVKVGLVTSSRASPVDPRQQRELDKSPCVGYLVFPDRWTPSDHPSGDGIKGRMPTSLSGGLLGAAAELLLRYAESLADAGESLLSRTRARAVVSTTPYSLWSHALLLAARRLGIRTVCMQQGLPTLDCWTLPVCDTAIVWSQLGNQLLSQRGWVPEQVVVSRNPAIPTAETALALRHSRRRTLGLADNDFCVLFLGQVSSDMTFRVAGYIETCRMVGLGLSYAKRSRPVVVLLRPHYRDKRRETERALRKDVPSIAVSQRTRLYDDIAAADVVISMYSTAMEEAYLMGRPIVQAVAEGCELGYDFRLLGAPLVRSSAELARCLTNQDWIVGRPRPPIRRSVANEIRDMLDSKLPKAQVRVSAEDTSRHQDRHGNHPSLGRDNPSTMT